MKLTSTPLPELYIVDTLRQFDGRGSFSRLFCHNELTELLGERKIAQINTSMTSQSGAIRGLHFQKKPAAEMKLVRCIRGEVFDVAVDLRLGSPTFLQWYGQILSAENAKMMVIPEGFAHGFQTQQADVEMLYIHTQFYAPEHEAGINFADTQLNIAWLLPITDVSDKDRNFPLLADDFKGIEI
ncbi:MAG: dTDP-4-dehydrorhamnose 3,5-epimerase [Paraglaciecola sp.]|jgi:dTDP-4-dehydrorhamnose 3,5-epimerase